MSNGIVYLIGAGPGDPGLLTRRAWELIQTVDVIVYDYLVDERLLEDCRSDCQKVYVGKEPGFHSITQNEISAIIVDYARKGKKVARFKGGDPFVFGRGGEEARQLAEEGIRFEIVPGVTAALAAAAYAGIPLTHRDWSSSLTFLTGHENPEKGELQAQFKDFARAGGTLCIYMGMRKLDFIVAELMAGGLAKDTPVAVVEWATLPRQRSVLTHLGNVVEQVSAEGLKAPAIVFVGAVTRFQSNLSWFEQRPLWGKRIALTRTRTQASRLRKALKAEGAEVIELPLIKVAPETQSLKGKAILGKIRNYDWIIFTSANGVNHFFELFFQIYSDLRSLGMAKIAVVGSTTAEALERYYLKPELMPKKFQASALVDSLLDVASLEGLKILVISGNLNSPDLPKSLSKAGASVEVLPVYRTELYRLEDAPCARDYREKGADAIVFASGSAVNSFIQQKESLALTENAKEPIVVSIGPITSAALKDAHISPTLEAVEPGARSIVEALVERWTNK